jgi:hypothetical protein
MGCRGLLLNAPDRDRIDCDDVDVAVFSYIFFFLCFSFFCWLNEPKGYFRKRALKWEQPGFWGGVNSGFRHFEYVEGFRGLVRLANSFCVTFSGVFITSTSSALSQSISSIYLSYQGGAIIGAFMI